MSEKPHELLGHSIRVDPGLLEGVLRRLVHLLGCLAAQEWGGLPKLRIPLGELLESGRRVHALLSHADDFLHHKVVCNEHISA